MTKKYFNGFILGIILLFLFVSAVSGDTPTKEEVIAEVLSAIQNENLGLITSNLEPSVVLTAGEEGISTLLSGEYEQLSEALQYYLAHFSYLDVSAIETVDQSTAGDIITSQLILEGTADNTTRTFEMEFIYTWEFTARNKIENLTIEFDSDSLNLLLNGQGDGHIISRYLVSAENEYWRLLFQQVIKELFKTISVELLRSFLNVYPVASLPPDAIVTPVTLVTGHPGEIFSLSTSVTDKIILYIHGGAYITGDLSVSRLFTYTIAKKTNIPVLAINYGLAPEDPFPAAPEDCYDVYEDLVNTYDPEDIVLMGESTGGGQVFAVSVLAQQRSFPLPGAIVAISPWADLTNSSASFITKRDLDAYLSSEILDNAADYYLDGTSATNEIASPVFATISDFPPVYLTVSSWEVLYDDSVNMFNKFIADGTDVTIEIGRGMIHVWPVYNYLDPSIPESEISNVNIANFIVDALY